MLTVFYVEKVILFLMEQLKAVYEQITSIMFHSHTVFKKTYIVGHLPVKPLMVIEVNRLYKVLARAFFFLVQICSFNESFFKY